MSEQYRRPYQSSLSILARTAIIARKVEDDKAKEDQDLLFRIYSLLGCIARIQMTLREQVRDREDWLSNLNEKSNELMHMLARVGAHPRQRRMRRKGKRVRKFK